MVSPTFAAFAPGVSVCGIITSAISLKRATSFLENKVALSGTGAKSLYANALPANIAVPVAVAISLSSALLSITSYLA